jgi:hypothetical protein
MLRNQPVSDLAQSSTLSSKTARRLGWGVAAAALFAGAILQVQDHGGGWLALGFALMPDLGLVAGIDRNLQKGQLAPRAVPIYNALHRFVGPVLLALLVIAGVLPAIWLSAALGWALHITVDRAVGYGLRGSDGFQRS